MKKRIIIRVDGGFCSQLAFFALGHYFEELDCIVKYDLRWYERNGKDNGKKFDRSFVINKAFPKLKYSIASRFERWFYRKFFKRQWTENKFPHHLYICGYPLREHLVQKYKDFYIKYFQPIDVYSISKTLYDIQNTNSCAVHIRRGDLAKYDPVYGMPPTPEYFLQAINYVLGLKPDSVFYFFSDEMEFVKMEILPKLNEKINYVICDNNGSDKGYLDLYLISYAKSIIASQGSFGKFGFFLNHNKKVLFVSQKTIKE